MGFLSVEENPQRPGGPGSGWFSQPMETRRLNPDSWTKPSAPRWWEKPRDRAWRFALSWPCGHTVNPKTWAQAPVAGNPAGRAARVISLLRFDSAWTVATKIFDVALLRYVTWAMATLLSCNARLRRRVQRLTPGGLAECLGLGGPAADGRYCAEYVPTFGRTVGSGVTGLKVG